MPVSLITKNKVKYLLGMIEFCSIKKIKRYDKHNKEIKFHWSQFISNGEKDWLLLSMRGIWLDDPSYLECGKLPLEVRARETTRLWLC